MSAKARILFVDDEKKYADTMAQVLRLQGFEVFAAYSGQQALQIFEPENIDLVITDLSMPKMDGIELITELRKLHPVQKIMVLTAFPSQRSQEQAFSLGTITYIAKPIKPKRFIELVNDSLREREQGWFGAVRLNSTDLIQLYSFMGRTIVLEVLKGENGEVGRIYFERGQVVHAETPTLSGKEAFYEIQTWESGLFKTNIPQKKVEHTIDEPINALLLKWAKKHDEDKSGKFNS